MRRPIEIALVVAALVALPLGVVVAARSQPTAYTSASARAVLSPLIRAASSTGRGLDPVDCRWSSDHTRVSCRLAGGGSCHFKVGGAGECRDASGNDTWQVVVLVGSDHRP